MGRPIKLTKAEGIALADALIAKVGYSSVAAALVSVIGAERSLALIQKHEGRITKAETVALVKEILPLVPGDTLKEKIKVAIVALRGAIPDRSRQDAILAYVVQRIKDYKAPPPQPPPQQQPIAEPTTIPDEIPFNKLKWSRGGDDFSGAKREPRCIIRDVRIRGGKPPTLSYRGEGFQKWPKREEDISHVWAIFFDEDQDGFFERGGKFDWGRTNCADRPMHHLVSYKNWDGFPRRGTPWAALITDIRGKLRSNVVTGVWP